MTHSCFGFDASDVPLNILPVPDEYISTIDVPYEGILEDINVTEFFGTHFNVGQLSVKLVSPQGTEVVLFDEICEGNQDFDLSFDDASPNNILPCPPTDGGVYQPEEPLSALIGEQTQGTWTLVITDDVSGGGGQLEGWALALCVGNAGTFDLTSSSGEIELCQGEETSIEVVAEEVFFFEDAIDLTEINAPSGVTVSFNPASILPGQTSTATFATSSDAEVGSFSPGILGTSGAVTDQLDIISGINLSDPQEPVLISPANGAEATGFALFEWEAVPSPSAMYELQLAEDESFATLIETVENISDNFLSYEGLPSNQTLFWRIANNNGCDESFSAPRELNTLPCGQYIAEDDLPLNISPVANEYLLTTEVPFSGVLSNIRITNIAGTHFRVSDLTMSLISPDGVEVLLFSDICEGENDFNLGFGTEGLSEIDCPATTGLLYQPFESFAAFEGIDPQGEWTLKVVDSVSGGGGQLVSWGLEICYDENVFSTENAPESQFGLFPNPTTDNVVIEMDGYIQNVNVFDVSGRLIGQFTGNGNKRLEISLGDFAEGVYLVQVNSDKGIGAKRLIKANQ